ATAEALGYVRRMMLNMDPPEHFRLRRLLTRSFTPRAVARLEQRIREHARALCARVLAGPRGECDFAKDLAPGPACRTASSPAPASTSPPYSTAINDLSRCGSPGPGTQFSSKEPVSDLAEVFQLGQVDHLADSADGVELELQHTLQGPAAEVVSAIPPVAAQELGQQRPPAAERVEVDSNELVVGVGDDRVSPVDEPDQPGPVGEGGVGGDGGVHEAGRREGAGKIARDLLGQMAGQAEAPEPLRRPGPHLPQDVPAGDRARGR